MFYSEWPQIRRLFITISFYFALDYTIMKVRQNKDGQVLSGTHILLVCVDDVDLLGKSIHTLNKYIRGVLAASKEAELKISRKKTSI